MGPHHRTRLIASCVLLSAVALFGSRLLHPVEGGLFDHRIVDYYKGRIVRTRPALGDLTRRAFMRPYSEEVLLAVASNHLLDGYRGADLKNDTPLTRFDIAFLVGRFIRLVNARDGKVFDSRRSLDHQHAYIPRKGWGLFEVEFALCERLLVPLWERGWWERTMTRYELAPLVGKLLALLEPHYELRVLFELYPPEGYADFAMYGHPTWFATRAAVVHGILQEKNGRFGGFDAVRGHEMAEAIDRLLTIVNGYRRRGAVPLPPTEPEGSGLALPRPDPYPEALRTLTHDVRESEMITHEIVQREVLGPEVRMPNANP